MATANLINEKEQVITGKDNIVIIDNLQSIRGGRTLDVSGYPYSVLKAGHVIIKDGDGEYKPMPITGDGDIVSLGTLTAGSGYTDGTHTGKSLTGGTGSGAKATIVVEDGKVKSVTVTTPGTGYKVGDELSASTSDIGAGTGFKIKVAEVTTEMDEYASLPQGCSYAGILVASIPTDRPFACIMIRGTVNVNATPFPMTSILAAVKTALPLIVFTSDKA